MITILCVASYCKGTTFLSASKALGCRVLLLTREKLRDAPWPHDEIDEIFYMPSVQAQPDVTYAVAYLIRGQVVDQIIPLDDYDVPTVAALREHLRLPGMGESVTRYFRDKLAMRSQARVHGLRVPEYSPVFNHARLAEWMKANNPPWLLKPRAEAGAMGIKQVQSAGEVWQWLNELGDRQSYFLLEQFVPGEVYHVDAVVWANQVVFALAHQYGRPPIDVAHSGGVFVTRTMDRQGADTRALLAFNEKLIAAFKMDCGVTHTEFIKRADGEFYFLETAARVGGANIEQLVEAASGVNLWAEWAKIEKSRLSAEAYIPPVDVGAYAGVLICLARQQWPDLSAYQETDIVYRIHKEYHAGLIVRSQQRERVESLIAQFGRRFAEDFLAVAPPLDTAPS